MGLATTFSFLKNTATGFLMAMVSGNTQAADAGEFYKLEAKTIDGKDFKFSSLKGKAVLIVNTASKCGFTNQYKGLEALHEEFKDKGLVVLGFPSNDFGKQEPGSETEIQQFCQLNFGVKFQLFKKAPVSGKEKQPVFQFLTEKAGKNGEVAWNFEKFLIDGQGHLAERYKSTTTPENDKFRAKVQELISLSQK